MGRIDVSAVLTKDDIQSVLGEPPQDTKRSGKSAGGFAVSQCFFTLPTFTKSIVVTVTERGEGPDARDPKEFWAATFHKDEDAKNGRPGEREEEEGKRLPPEKVEGTGDEAFWSGTRVGGTLYVLKGNKFVSVGIGGADDAPTRLKKAKALADLLVKRL